MKTLFNSQLKYLSLTNTQSQILRPQNPVRSFSSFIISSFSSHASQSHFSSFPSLISDRSVLITENESLIKDEGVTITDHSISDVIPLKNHIESVKNLTSSELKDNNKEKSQSALPLNITNKDSDFLSPSNESNRHSFPLSKNTTTHTIFNRKRITVTELDWKEMWSHKFTKYLRLGIYTPDFSDKLLFSYLNEKTQTIKSKYSFNDFLSGSQLITYNFNKNFKKVDLNSLYKYLKAFFRNLSSLISVPALEIYSDKIKIRLFYYVVPSKTKQEIHKRLHRYIRSDDKLYKELILRRKFKNIMEQFKMKLFIAKWKEDNYLIRIPNPISFFKGLSLTLNEGHTIINKSSGSGSVDSPKPLGGDCKRTNCYDLKVNIENTHKILLRSDPNTSLSFDSLDSQLDSVRFRALSHTDTDTQAIIPAVFSSIGLPNISVSNHSPFVMVMKNVISPNSEDLLKINTSEAEELQSKSTAVISTSTQTDKIVHMLDKIGSAAKQNNTNACTTPDSLTNLKDRTVSTIVSLNRDKFKYLIYTLEKLFKKTIILDLIRLKYPYHESNILAQVLSLSCKTKDFRQIIRKLLYTATISTPTKMVRRHKFTIIPSYLSGIKVRLGGRLITQRVVPRFTVQSLQIGSLARGKVNFTDCSRITLKNKRGAFSFTVTTSHIFER